MRRGFGRVICVLAIGLSATPSADATWSIVIADAQTKEVAVGTVTCLNQFDLLAIVPVVVVGKGAAAVQAAGDFAGIRRPIIFDALANGTLPQEILLTLAGITGHEVRQYGIVDTRGAMVTFTGADTFQWAGGVTGSACTMFYAIQGNILAGECVVPAIEQAVLDTDGDIAEKLMAGMRAARGRGGDGRCSCSQSNATGCGCPPPGFAKSGHIGCMVVARIGDSDDPLCDAAGCADGDYFLRINVPFQSNADPDPVLQLQAQFDAFRSDLAGRPDAVQSPAVFDPAQIPPDGVSQTTMTITLLDWQNLPIGVPIQSVAVAHAPQSAGISSIGAVVDNGDGTFSMTITAGTTTGIDRFEVTIDDGIRPVVLMPAPVLEYCGLGACQLDCNRNGISDICDIGQSTSGDCNHNLIPDECEIADGTSVDCNGNGVPDECEPDCNGNGVADGCDIANGTSTDIDGNGVPDDCHQILFVPSAEHPTIQSAIDATVDGDSVLVEDGIYTGLGNRDLTFGGRAILVRSRNGPASCIIDCQGSERAFTFQGGETTSTIVDGFTIINGFSNRGGAIDCDLSSPTIRNCILSGNTATSLGGAISVRASSPHIRRCTIVGNTAGSRGGGLHLAADSDPLIRDCLIAYNSAGIGGGISTVSAGPVIQHCTLSANTATASLGGGGMYCSGSSSVTLSDSILWGDTAPAGAEIQLASVFTELVARFNDVEGGAAAVAGPGTLLWLDGNLNIDPAFVDPDAGDYHLLRSSPCIDAGDPDVTADQSNTDIDGDPRVVGARVDIGADEFRTAGDINADGVVNADDLEILITSWGPCDHCAGCPADINDDCAVNVPDLLRLLANWG